MAAVSPAPSPVPVARLKEIAHDACESALGNVEHYDHSKTDQWNQTIINSILKAVITESQPANSPTPTYKFAINSTIVQHHVPTAAQSSKSTGTSTEATSASTGDAEAGDSKTASLTNARPSAGRRGMHSATGAYWNEKTDGMWSFKYDADMKKGLDVVLMLIWVAI